MPKRWRSLQRGALTAGARSWHDRHLEIHLLRDASVKRGMDAADERKEMRREHQAHLASGRLRHALANLGPMPVTGNVVRHEIVGSLGERELQLRFARLPTISWR